MSLTQWEWLGRGLALALLPNAAKTNGRRSPASFEKAGRSGSFLKILHEPLADLTLL
jgi:hypothetical protein